MKTYAVTLKLIGEARLIDIDGPVDNTVDVASIRKDFGKIAETICKSPDLILMRSCKPRMVKVDGSMPEFMIEMLHLARDMDSGQFRGQALAEAVKDGVLCGGSMRGDVSHDMLRRLDKLGLTVISPLVPSNDIN